MAGGARARFLIRPRTQTPRAQPTAHARFNVIVSLGFAPAAPRAIKDMAARVLARRSARVGGVAAGEPPAAAGQKAPRTQRGRRQKTARTPRHFISSARPALSQIRRFRVIVDVRAPMTARVFFLLPLLLVGGSCLTVRTPAGPLLAAGGRALAGGAAAPGGPWVATAAAGASLGDLLSALRSALSASADCTLEGPMPPAAALLHAGADVNEQR